MEKYFNHAIIGNGKTLACLDDNAELLRLYYPNIDYYQNINQFSLGFVFDGENKAFWFKDAEKINQYYDGNILFTKLKYNHTSKENGNSHSCLNHFDTDIFIRDYVLVEKNILVRKIKFNEPVSLLIYSKLNSSPDKLVSGLCVQNSLIQYSQEFYMSTFSKTKIIKSQINNPRERLAFADLH